MGRSYGVLLCAVLSGVDAESLGLEGTGTAYGDLVELTRGAGGVNGTGKIETGAIVSIALGGVAALLLVIGLAWWYFMRERSGARNADVAPANSGIGLFDFAIPASDCPLADQMPLLRLTTASNGAK